ncbi:ester cyclase (plasmid) [Deinococcus taeanensis]|uniref:ester cyclase n=1 Tax=Deinococcus taeanensis TaxID=2737050 RepID=UPI001CDBCCED|nr:ester cyclase [Deinococcus taeanensis]UBV45102.1 ester cyclase [Deinococcus taeanensis]
MYTSTSDAPVSARTTQDVLNELLVGHAAHLYAVDAVLCDMTQPQPVQGREAILAYLSVFYGGAFRNVSVKPVTMMVNGSTAILEFSFLGTHSGPQLGMPATGRDVHLHLIAVYRIEEGLIRETRLYYDSAELPRQLNPDS